MAGKAGRSASRRASFAAASVAVVSVLALGVALVDDGLAGAAAGGHGTRSAAGSPERGRAVYLANGCAGCHGSPSGGSSASGGPQLTLALLRSSAESAGKPLGAFVAESIVNPTAFTSPGYVSGVMRSFAALPRQQLDDLVSYLIGAPYSSSTTDPARVPARPVAACKADRACVARVARWAKAERLPAATLDGARITAIAGCLSCHRYAGSGRTRGAAPELTRLGRQAPTVAALVRRLRCPDCVVPGSTMPSYAALGAANLRAVASFLRASKGVRP